MKALKTLLASTLLIALCGCVMMQAKPEKDVLLPPGTLDKAAVTALFSGKSVKSVLDRDGRVSLTYYNANGELSQRRDDAMRSGLWNVRNDGRICLQFEGHDPRCRIIVKEGPVYRKYIVKRDGNHEGIITYKSFRDGNLVDQ